MQNDKPVVLITAASQGIGRAIATHIARTWTVVLLARAETIETIGAALGGLGVRGSVTDEADLKQLVDTALQRFGRIDAVLNNTGHPAKGDPLALSDTEWQQGYELILGSVIRLARLVTPVMIRQKRGAFVNISSYAAKQPDAVRPVSSVFRAALSAWTRVQAEAGAPHGIRVNSILPGFVDPIQWVRRSWRRSRWGESGGSRNSRRLWRSCSPTRPRTSRVRTCCSMAAWCGEYKRPIHHEDTKPRRILIWDCVSSCLRGVIHFLFPIPDNLNVGHGFTLQTQPPTA